MSPLIYIISAAILTFIIRLIPYIFMDHITITNKVKHIIDTLPVVVMSLLVVYCFKDLRVNTSLFLPSLIGALSVIIIHLYKKNTILSILFGTIIYMICLQIL